MESMEKIKTFECPVFLNNGTEIVPTEISCIVHLNGVPKNYQVDEIIQIISFDAIITPYTLIELTVIQNGELKTFDSGMLRYKKHFFNPEHSEFIFIPNKPSAIITTGNKKVTDIKIVQAVERMLERNNVSNREYLIEFSMPIIVVEKPFDLHRDARNYILRTYHNRNCLAVVYQLCGQWEISFLGQSFEATIAIEMKYFGIKAVFKVNDCLIPVIPI